MSADKQSNGSVVLVGVINRRKDLEILLEKGWYRVPVRYAPKRRADYLAFYQTGIFGRDGRGIRYYGRINSMATAKRVDLLPDEKAHPRANEDYYRFNVSVRKTPNVIHNDSRRRVSFGFTSIGKLRRSKRICELFDIVPLEDIVRRALEREGLGALHEYCVMEVGRCRYRLDFAIFCKRGKIAVECDNEEWHRTPALRVRDKERDRYLKKRGWVIIRLPGRDIQDDLRGCLGRIKRTADQLGGIQSQE